jgi:hypothetical protein
MGVIVGPERVGYVSDPNISGKGNFHPEASQVKLMAPVFCLEGIGKDRNPAIVDMHLPDLGELFELIQIFQVLLWR